MANIQLLLPPLQSGGVYDFARQLHQAIGPDRSTLVHLAKQDAGGWQVEPNDTVFLQLSGYGFQKRGAPLWLLRALKSRRANISTLITFFHELYAFGPPWSSSFWLSPLQRFVSYEIAKLSDCWITSREQSATWLLDCAGDKPHACLPVFSTIGEPDFLPEKKQRRIVVFGSAGLRQEAYQNAGERLFRWAARHALEIHDVGSPITDGHVSATLKSFGAHLHGRLDEQSARSILADSAYGLVSYPTAYVAKSSIFAAYCAHAVVPILLSKQYSLYDDLAPGREYLAGVPADDEIAAHEAVRQAAWSWYQPHKIQRHVRFLSEIILSNTNK